MSNSTQHTVFFYKLLGTVELNYLSCIFTLALPESIGGLESLEYLNVFNNHIEVKMLLLSLSLVPHSHLGNNNVYFFFFVSVGASDVFR